MEFTGIGTAVMFALAAVLWFAYLVPTWFRRREYLATERNATRLQQTLRIMAETAEVPDEVRVEATARHAARQARILDEKRRVEDARERAALSAVRRAAAPVITAAERARRRLRRARLVAASTLLVAIAAAVVQGTLMLATGVSTGAWVVLGSAGLVAFLSYNVLAGLARRRPTVPTAEVAGRTEFRAAYAPRDSAADSPAATARPGWTPVPVPRPLYLDRPAAQSVVPPRDAERLMREASAAAQAALRAAHREAEVTSLPNREVEPQRTAAVAERAVDAPSAEASRWAGMGVVGDVPTERPDLDEVLRRRRLAG